MPLDALPKTIDRAYHIVNIDPALAKPAGELGRPEHRVRGRGFAHGIPVAGERPRLLEGLDVANPLRSDTRLAEGKPDESDGFLATASVGTGDAAYRERDIGLLGGLKGASRHLPRDLAGDCPVFGQPVRGTPSSRILHSFE